MKAVALAGFVIGAVLSGSPAGAQQDTTPPSLTSFTLARLPSTQAPLQSRSTSALVQQMTCQG